MKIGRSSLVAAGIAALAVAWLPAHGARAAIPFVERPAIRPIRPGAPLPSDGFERLAAAFLPAVVRVEVEGPMHVHGPGDTPHPRRSRATGFVIHPDGWVLTNQHVIAKARAVRAIFASGESYDADVVAWDAPTDVAVLKLRDVHKPLPTAPLGHSSQLRPGSFVIAIGNPFGLNFTVTAGIISRSARYDVHIKERAYPLLLQTDAFIHKGSSGGPLIGLDARVVGITAAIRHENLTFAVPVDVVRRVLRHLDKGPLKRGWLGIRYRSPRAGESRAGAEVEWVDPAGPAARAGVRAGDLIVAFDGHPVHHYRDLQWLVPTAGAGSSVVLVVQRKSKRVTLHATLAEAPGVPVAGSGPSQSPSSTPSPNPSRDVAGVGLRLEARGASVVIAQVDPDGPAARAGAKTGDRLVSIDGVTPASTAEAMRLLREAVKEGFVDLIVERDGSRYLVPIEIP